MRHPPGRQPVVVRPPAAVHGAPVGVRHLVARGEVAQCRAHGVVGRQRVGLQRTQVQEAHVRGVDVPFQCLQPVAVALQAPDLGVGHQVGLDQRQRRRLGAVAHVDPDEAIALGRAVGARPHLVLEVFFRRHVGHFDAAAVDVELPAVVDAAQAAILVAAEEQAGAAVRAAVVHDAHAAGAVAKGDQPLAQQHQAQRVAIGGELARQHGRQPVLAHQAAHQGAGAHVHEVGAVGVTHGGRPSWVRSLAEPVVPHGLALLAEDRHARPQRRAPVGQLPRRIDTLEGAGGVVHRGEQAA